MLTAAETQKGHIYRRTRRSQACTYYQRPRISKEAYLARLQRKLNGLNGREVAMLHQARTDDSLILLQAVTRSRSEQGIIENKTMALVAPDYPLRQIKSRPTPKKRTS